MRVQNLLSAAVLAGGLIVGGAAPALASPVASAVPASAASCTLTVTDLYWSIGQQTAFARLGGGCTSDIDITLVQAATPAGPFVDVDAGSFVQQAADHTAATAYFDGVAQRGYCKAKATALGLTTLSTNAVAC